MTASMDGLLTDLLTVGLAFGGLLRTKINLFLPGFLQSGERFIVYEESANQP